MDDIFCGANEETTRVSDLLGTFEQASGQKVNLQKSSIYFSSNVDLGSQNIICQNLNMTEADERTTYMGLPNIIGRNKSVTLGFLRKKIRQKLQSWDGKLLSQASREILVKSVAQTQPRYTMSVFLLPWILPGTLRESFLNSGGVGKRITTEVFIGWLGTI